MTKSFEAFLVKYHKDLLVPLSFGHVELLTDEIWREYLSWGKTDEARPYLMGGEFYEEAK